GPLINSLKSTTSVSPELEQSLGEALGLRNWLAHGFFRDRSTSFMSESGRDRMIQDLEHATAIFQEADNLLEKTLSPLWARYGITEEVIDMECQRLIDEEHTGRSPNSERRND
ncbi:hypothetical protein, partial [Guyparkeria halopsychrophila]|uniref:hypothetical protein n=1 Tax=Guyparkeria halopsychrophila TaxID=3139421 RepID=UPI0037C9089B